MTRWCWWRASAARVALTLLTVFVAAKAAWLALRAAADGGGAAELLWLPRVLRADLLCALALALLDAPLRRLSPWRRLRGGAYGALVLLAAVNVPAARLFGTPLTFSLVHAAGGALSDSLRPYITGANAAALLFVLGVGGLAPRLWARLGPRGLHGALGAGLLLLLPPAGPAGLSRNALVTLLSTTLLHRAPARLQLSRWLTGRGAATTPAPLAPEGERRDLRALRGAARGLDVLWVVLESTGAGYLGPYGAPAPDPMPQLSALAAQGMVFERVYAAYPESIKGFYSMLCAATPAAHTVAPAYAAERLPCAALPRRFQEAGYRTGLFHSGWFPYLDMDQLVRGRGFDLALDAGAMGGAFLSSFGVDEAATVRRVLRFFDEAPGPRFVMYLPIAGQHPYEAPGPRERPRPFPTDTELGCYQNDLRYGDQALAALVAGLRERGLLARTLLVVSGDHGEAFYQHPGNFAHTLHLYEENLHVPLVLYAPGRIPAGRAAQVGSVIDIAPTLLELAGLPVPPGYEGRPLLGAEPGVARFFTDHTTWLVGLRQGRWKMIHEVQSGRSQLFDLDADPGERVDRAASEPARARRYRDHLLGWSAWRLGAVVTPGALRAAPD